MLKWRRYYVKIRHVIPTSKERQFDVNQLRIYVATSKCRYVAIVGYHWAYRIIFLFAPETMSLS